jgi:preprotein translocase subunit SecG
VLTKTTTVLGALFLIISIGLALMNRSPAGTGVEEAGRALSTETGNNEWYMDNTNPIVPDIAPFSSDAGTETGAEIAP